MLFIVLYLHCCFQVRMTETKYVIEFSPVTEHDFGKVEITKACLKKLKLKILDSLQGLLLAMEIVDSPAFRWILVGCLCCKKMNQLKFT